MVIYTPSIDVQKWYPDKSDITKWVYDIIKYLNDTPIPTEEDVAKAVDEYLKVNPITGDFYSPENPPPYPVTSVNGKTGAVQVDVDTSGLYGPTNPPPYPVTSVNGKTGAVTGLYSADNKPPYPVKSVNGKTGAVTGLYDASNPPPYPVTSVNGKTGAVTVPGFSVSTTKNIVISNDNTGNVTLTLEGYTEGVYKAIFVHYRCITGNKDTGVYLITSNNDYIATGISDFDGGQYGYTFAGIVFYPTAFYDGATLKLTASDGDAQLSCTPMYWWGVS